LKPGYKSVLTKYPEGEKVLEWSNQKSEGSIDAIKEAFKSFKPRCKPTQSPKLDSFDIATVYMCADWHVGLLSWGRETGVNWDLDIAQGVIKGAIGRLIQSSPSTSQGVVLGLGDLLHSDGYDGVTPTSKHILDTDGRYPKILQCATLLILHTVHAALTKHKKVLVRILPGNHDPESAIAVTLALHLFFQNEPRVTVDDDPSYFWWWRWGKCLLGATHGDQAKMPDLPLIMASRNPDDWAKSKWRHIFSGHVHSQTGMEKAGVTVESFQTLTAPDAWHNRRGYGATRSITAVNFHKDFGEVSRHKSNII
jgi:hypothetical protein